MTKSLPFRSRVRNSARATAADARLFVVASRIVTVDRLEIALRGEFEGSFEAAKRHAVRLSAVVASRFGCAACCDITNNDGLPLFSCSTGAAR